MKNTKNNMNSHSFSLVLIGVPESATFWLEFDSFWDFVCFSFWSFLDTAVNTIINKNYIESNNKISKIWYNFKNLHFGVFSLEAAPLEDDRDTFGIRGLVDRSSAKELL